ncbi:TSUP family transporter [Desulfotalea psychrophila]|nr:TSUP family transporter [Desulfotalea psychrophila]
MEGIDLSFQIFIFLFIVGAVAGLVDSIAGGGGLIALPALLFVGLPPQLALGTNKLQGCFGTFSASYNFVRTGHVSLRGASSGIIFTLLGAGLGAWLVQQLSAGFTQYLIPVMLCIVFLYIMLSPRLGFEERGAKMSIFAFSLVFGMSLGFYDGFFGPGTGSFWTMACMTMMGMNMTRASGYTKIMNFTQ